MAFKHDKLENIEICSLCVKEIPPSALILRKVETNKFICLICLMEIASMKMREKA